MKSSTRMPAFGVPGGGVGPAGRSNQTRRQFLGSLGSTTFSISLAGTTTSFAAPIGGGSSYLGQILEPGSDNVVFYWVDAALEQIRDHREPPPRSAYILGLVAATGFLAANGVERAYGEPYGIGDGPPSADPEVAYGVAFSMAAEEAFQQPFFRERNAFLKLFPDGEAKSLGVQWGRTVGRMVLDQRTDDGSEPSEVNYYLGRYVRRQDVLQWSPTAPYYGASPGPAFPSFGRCLFPGHGQITPWTMTNGSQFRVTGFHDPRSPEFAEEFNTVRRLGGMDSTTRTVDESEIALFWEDGPWGITNPGHFLYIAIQLLQDRGLSFIELARAVALVGMTQCDASICSWDNKYLHDILRPETAIRDRAALFDNPDPRVEPENGWHSYIPTPEFPAYTSGHATFGAAAAEMIALFLGQDDIAFSGRAPDYVLWPQLQGVRRHWTSLSHMAEENAMSRLYGGVHWAIDNDRGLVTGREIARQAFLSSFPKRA